MYCCAVMDTCSRRIVGWSIDSVQDAQLVVNALDMAIRSARRSWAPSSMRTTASNQLVGVHWQCPPGRPDAVLRIDRDAFDNTMMESFWSTMQIELLDRKRWKTRVELSNAIFEYIEVFYNRRRRHSMLGYVSPIEFERSMSQQIA